MHLIELDTVASTNIHAQSIIAEMHPQCFVVTAKEQTKGKGQQGNVWHSEKAKNLLFSIAIYPHPIKADEQFILNKITALAVKTFIDKHLNTESKIKWPNDIYIANKKVAGILIEHSVTGNQLKHTVIGIGINVNQKHFPENVPNPVSMYNISGIEYDLKVLLNSFVNIFFDLYNTLGTAHASSTDKAYLNALYNYNIKSNYLYKNKEIAATIKDVDTYGRLILLLEDGQEIKCGNKEIVFL